MAIFIVGIICWIIFILKTLYFDDSNPLYRKHQANWFAHEAFTTTDPVLKEIAFREWLRWEGLKDYQIVRATFEDLEQSGLI